MTTKYVNVNNEVIAFLASAFQDADLTTAAAARKCGFSQPTLSRLMKGQTDLSVSRVFDILGALGRDPAEFVAYLMENCVKRGKAAATVAKPVKKTAARPTSAVAEKTERYAAKAAAKGGKTATKKEVAKPVSKVAGKTGVKTAAKSVSKPKASVKALVAAKATGKTVNRRKVM